MHTPQKCIGAVPTEPAAAGLAGAAALATTLAAFALAAELFGGATGLAAAGDSLSQYQEKHSEHSILRTIES